jgi:ubiquinone biosynthesis protein Coq4
MNLAKLLSVFRLYRAGAPLGDVVVLKLDALATAPHGMDAKLAALEEHAFAPDLAVLRRMPAGSLGREYARFCDANGIVPLDVSPAVRERFRRSPYALRYTSTHDLHHVLAGFDAGLAGEMGVLAFNVGQGAAPVSRAMLRFAAVLYTLLSPTQARTIANNVRVGLAMGRSAALVMAAPLESWLGEPLEEVRRRLGIPDPREAGVLPSGRALVNRLLMRPAA